MRTLQTPKHFRTRLMMSEKAMLEILIPNTCEVKKSNLNAWLNQHTSRDASVLHLTYSNLVAINSRWEL